MQSFFYRVFCGFFLGISVFAPGISGSVMAVLMGIYMDLLEIISNPFKNFKRNVVYVFPMGIGALISLILFVLVFSHLFKTYERATYLLFVALMIGNLPTIFKDAYKSDVTKKQVIATFLAFIFTMSLGLLKISRMGMQASADDVSMPYLALSGAIGGASSMVPGMSISMMLMLLGVYEPLLEAAKTLNIPVIFLVGTCFVIAMVAFSRVTKYVFKTFGKIAHSLVFGFICGSLLTIILGLPQSTAGSAWFMDIVMILIGLGISMLFIFLGKTMNADNPTDQ